MDAPLTMEANSFSSLENEIISTFDLKGSVSLMYCGKILSKDRPLPRDGATIYASVKQPSNHQKFSQSAPAPPLNPKFEEAVYFIHRHQNPRSPTREKLRQIVESHIEKRYQTHPNLCKKSIEGARLCSNYDLFIASILVDKRVGLSYELIQSITVDIYLEAKEKFSSISVGNPAATSSGIPSIVPFGGVPAGNASTRQNRNESRGNQMITSAMLSQALSAASGATRAGVAATPTQANQAAAEVAALSQAVESGLAQLRELGILAQTTEANAQRILVETGGNVEAAVNRILENL